MYKICKLISKLMAAIAGISLFLCLSVSDTSDSWMTLILLYGSVFAIMGIGAWMLSDIFQTEAFVLAVGAVMLTHMYERKWIQTDVGRDLSILHKQCGDFYSMRMRCQEHFYQTIRRSHGV